MKPQKGYFGTCNGLAFVNVTFSLTLTSVLHSHLASVCVLVLVSLEVVLRRQLTIGVQGVSDFIFVLSDFFSLLFLQKIACSPLFDQLGVVS